MKTVRPGLGDYVDLSATVVSVLRVKVIRENPDISNRIQVRNRARTGESGFLRKYAVQNESIRRLSHAIHGLRPGILIPGNLRQREPRGDEASPIRTRHP